MPESPPPSTNHNRLCDNCNQSTALLYCRADTAKLCLSCDREVHSTNPLFTKHTRSLLCDTCNSSPASIFCSTHTIVHCHNCDWETHNNSSNSHNRRPIEGFTGCPSVTDLLSILGFDDLSKKGVLNAFGSDCVVWESPGFVSLDDLIVSSGGSDHGYQAMVVPPLPKNRNAALGTYKDELLNQLRELAKSDPNVDDGQEMIKPITEVLPTQDFPLEGWNLDFEHMFEENVNFSNEANAFQWCPDGGDAGDVEFYFDQLAGHNTDGNCVVPDGNIINVHDSSRIIEDGSHCNVAENTQITQVFHGVGAREINTQERETALTRYKEKKKSRRYDKHIRYESRKVRAENRSRIKGRFAKIDR